MASRTPKMRDGILEIAGCESGLHSPVFAGSAGWYEWLEHHTSFGFEAKCGRFTAHKRERSGSPYWYAYQRMNGKLVTVYLGKTADLTPQRLEEAALATEAATTAVHVTQSRSRGEALPPDAAVVATKFALPRHRLVLVPRPRLQGWLNHSLVEDAPYRLVLVSAPAGYGKTTLLSEWAHHCPWPVAWIALDGGDNDPVRFLADLVAALDGLAPNLGVRPSTMFGASLPAAPEAAITLLINTLSKVRRHFVLVLDDYHAITAQSVHDALLFLVERLPSVMRLIIASRGDPPLPLARLRVRGQLAELRTADLSFTAQEAEVFLNHVMGLALRDEEVEDLATHAEGWIAGLQLAALSLHGRDSEVARQLIHGFSGNQRLVLDYLAEEVLRQQPQAVQSFLLRTSVLERLSGSLCDALTGGRDGQEMLEWLERANLFILPLDENRQWYRYHLLFAEFLRNRLAQTERDSLAEIHRRAAQWLQANGFPDDGIAHALAAEDFVEAADLIEQSAQTHLTRGEVATLQGWLSALPEDLIRRRPSLSLVFAWVLAFGDHLDAVATYVDAAEAGLGTLDLVSAKEKSTEIATIRALMAGLRLDLTQLTELAERGFEGLPEDNLFLRSLGALAQALARDFSGDTASAASAYLATSILARAAGVEVAEQLAVGQMADSLQLQGRLRQAAETYHQAMAILPAVAGAKQSQRVSAWARLPYVGLSPILPYFGLAGVLYEWNDLDAAEQHLARALELAQQAVKGRDLVFAFSYALMARLRLARGDAAGAREVMARAVQVLGDGEEDLIFNRVLNATRARVWLAQGDLQAATGWLRGIYPSSPTPGAWWSNAALLREIEDPTAARILTCQGRYDEALRLMAALLAGAEAGGRTTRVIEMLVVQALTLEAAGDPAAAIACLGRALVLGEPEGFVRTFVDEGVPLASLLSTVWGDLKQGRWLGPAVSLGYVNHLLCSFGACALDDRSTEEDMTKVSAKETGAAKAAGPGLPGEPITEREREVLKLAAVGMSNGEIAQRLTIEVSTVKTHLVHLYGKLAARNRAQAAAKARELGLL